jgi:dienelactone hydrolase
MMTRALLAISLFLIVGSVHAAPTPACSTTVDFKYVTYKDGTVSNDKRCPSGGSCRVTMHGLLYYPRTKGTFPIIIYSHGSGSVEQKELDADSFCEPAKYFVDNGYVVFLPFRRGQGDKKHTSSGPSIAKSLTALGLSKPAEDVSTGKEMYWFYKASLLREETSDLVEAIDWVRDPAQLNAQMPVGIRVDSKKLALMGHSYGAQVTLFANEADHGQQCAVAFSAGGESWAANAYTRDGLLHAAAEAKRAVYALQPYDEEDTRPQASIAWEMSNKGPTPLRGKRHQAAIFPEVCPTANPARPDSGPHWRFAHHCTGQWGKSVLAFLELYGAR